MTNPQQWVHTVQRWNSVRAGVRGGLRWTEGGSALPSSGPKPRQHPVDYSELDGEYAGELLASVGRLPSLPAKEMPDAEYTIANDASTGSLWCGQWHILALTLMLLLVVFLWPKEVAQRNGTTTTTNFTNTGLNLAQAVISILSTTHSTVNASSTASLLTTSRSQSVDNSSSPTFLQPSITLATPAVHPLTTTTGQASNTHQDSTSPTRTLPTLYAALPINSTSPTLTANSPSTPSPSSLISVEPAAPPAPFSNVSVIAIENTSPPSLSTTMEQEPPTSLSSSAKPTSFIQPKHANEYDDGANTSERVYNSSVVRNNTTSHTLLPSRSSKASPPLPPGITSSPTPTHPQGDQYDGSWDPLYQSVSHVRPFVGNLSDTGALEDMLSRRSFQSEIIAFYATLKFASMTLNAVLNLLNHGIAHFIVIMNDADQCEKYIDGSKGLADSCAWQSGPVVDDPTDFFFKPSKLKPKPLKVELGTRHYFTWRFLSRGINVLWLDSDVHMARNPYPYFKSELKDVNFIIKSHMLTRVEINTGIMYAQNVHPDGPVSQSFKETFERWSFAHHNKPIFNHNGVDVTRGAIYEQQIMSDVILSHVGICQQTYRLSHQENDFDLGSLQRLGTALANETRIPMCTKSRGLAYNETLKLAGTFEFGWKREAWESYRAVYKSLQQGRPASESAQILKDTMPFLVHVRDIGGGHYWEKNWRMAQLEWWDPRIDFPEDFGDLVQTVVSEKRGLILQLSGVEKLPTPEVYLNTVEWFVKLAIMMRRVPVLPELPCPLTLMEWPSNCPNGSHIYPDDHNLWWFTVARARASLPHVEDEQADIERMDFRCSVNERACQGNCLGNRFHEADLDSFLTYTDAFRTTFPDPPFMLSLAGVATGSDGTVKVSDLHQLFDNVANITNVAIHVNDLPKRYGALSWVDELMLKGCASPEGAVQQRECAIKGFGHFSCKKLEKCPTYFDLAFLDPRLYDRDRIPARDAPLLVFNSAGEAASNRTLNGSVVIPFLNHSSLATRDADGHK